MAHDRTDILRKVKGLLDKAESTDFPGERDALMAKADQLMAVYAIETFELDMAKGESQREKPEVRWVEYKVTNSHLFNMMPYIFMDLAGLARCEVGQFGWSKSAVVGYAADLDYLDLLTTTVMMQAVRSLDPKADPGISYVQNLYNLKSAGFKWQRIYEELLPYFPEKFSKGRVPEGSHDMEVAVNPNVSSWRKEQDLIWVGENLYYRKIPRNIGVRFTAEYKKFCEETGAERNMSNPDTYQRNFADAFRYTLSTRIREMKRGQREASAGKGLVLAGREGSIKDALYEAFPDKKPHEPNCRCQRCSAARKPVRYRREPERKFDAAAHSAGSRAAKNVDLSGGRNNLKATKELR